MDPQKGTLSALIDGIYITALRDGASAAIAVRFLAKKCNETIGVFGSDTLARSCLQGIFKDACALMITVGSNTPTSRDLDSFTIKKLTKLL